MKSIKLSLYCGAVYFFLMSIAHAVSFKFPGLFIYFNVPSYPYQDKIVSLLAFGWAMFFFTVAQNPLKNLIRTLLICGGTALLMLTYINLSTDFVSLAKNIDPHWFNIEIIALFAYWFWLIVCYRKIK